MQNCGKCFDNDWKYEYIEGWIRAICNNCFNEIEFPSKKIKKKLAEKEIFYNQEKTKIWKK